MRLSSHTQAPRCVTVESSSGTKLSNVTGARRKCLRGICHIGVAMEAHVPGYLRAQVSIGSGRWRINICRSTSLSQRSNPRWRGMLTNVCARAPFGSTPRGRWELSITPGSPRQTKYTTRVRRDRGVPGSIRQVRPATHCSQNMCPRVELCMQQL
ncbi:hypothetical protein OH77DRAFT_614214 [Trametes cingulata]|nr:hypothetical protein OH77DRAFT_614214 [Trametes cingulata]